MKKIIEFEDFKNKYSNLEGEDWIPLYNYQDIKKHGVKDDIFEFSAFIENDEKYIKKYLTNYDWRINTDSFGKSYFGEKYSQGKNEIYFDDGTIEDEFEYLVAVRNFNDKYKNQVEINPKLIWYYNLAKVDNSYIDPITEEYCILIH